MALLVRIQEFPAMYSMDTEFWILYLNLLLAYGKLFNVSEPLTFCKIMIATYLTEVLRLNKINLL